MNVKQFIYDAARYARIHGSTGTHFVINPIDATEAIKKAAQDVGLSIVESLTVESPYWYVTSAEQAANIKQQDEKIAYELRAIKEFGKLEADLAKAKELIGRMKEHLQKSCPPSLSCNQCLLKDCKRKNLIAEAEEVMK